LNENDEILNSKLSSFDQTSLPPLDDNDEDCVRDPFEQGFENETAYEETNSNEQEHEENSQNSRLSQEQRANAEAVNNEIKTIADKLNNEGDEDGFKATGDTAQIDEKNKSPKMSKNLIIGLIVGIFAIGFIVSVFVLPLVSKLNTNKKGQADSMSLSRPDTTDYSKLAFKAEEAVYEEESEPEIPSYEDLADPPIADEFLYKPPESTPVDTVIQQSPSTTTIAAAPKPNTANEGLNSRTIKGIKGLTGTHDSKPSGNDTANSGSGTYNPYAQFGLPSKADYTNQLLSMAGNTNGAGQRNAAPSMPGTGPYGQRVSPYEAQNDQAGKESFFNEGRNSLSAGTGAWLPSNSIWQGSIFEAALLGEVNTDLPGQITAIVTKNIYSSQSGQYLLIPQNSRLMGSYNSNISYGQRRVQVAWNTLIRPDGYQLDLGNMQATDPQGAAGLTGRINDHLLQQLWGVVLITALNIGNAEARLASESLLGENLSNPYIQKIVDDDLSVINQFAQNIIDRQMNIQPTIKIKAGTKINIVANLNLVLPPMKDYPVTEPYIRR
jgi:type IV secretion system protein VirB10